MKYTVTANLPYPEAGDPLASIATTTQSLAEAMVAEENNITGQVTKGASFNLTQVIYTKLLGDSVVFWDCIFQYAGGSALTGNFGDVEVFNFNVQLPSVRATEHFVPFLSGADLIWGRFAGTRLYASHTATSMIPGHNLRLQAVVPHAPTPLTP